MLGELLPGQVVAVEQVGGLEPAQLYPEEAAAMAGAAAKRRLEFAAARSCARAALAQLGLPPVAIMPGERGAPTWPAGVVGSMTHCAGYCAAALARAADIASLGIDAEPHRPLPEGVAAMVASEAEAAHIAELTSAEPGIRWDMILFSAKESVYKAWFPLMRRWLDFSEASITFDPRGAGQGGHSATWDSATGDSATGDSVTQESVTQGSVTQGSVTQGSVTQGYPGPQGPGPQGPGTPRSGAFAARLLVPGPEVAGRAIGAFAGRWLVRDGLVLTAVVVMA